MSGRPTFSTTLSASVRVIPQEGPSPGTPPVGRNGYQDPVISGQSIASSKHSDSETQLQKPLTPPGQPRPKGKERAKGTAEKTHAKVAGFIVLLGPAAVSGQQTDLDIGREAGAGQDQGTP